MDERPELCETLGEIREIVLRDVQVPAALRFASSQAQAPHSKL